MATMEAFLLVLSRLFGLYHSTWCTSPHGVSTLKYLAACFQATILNQKQCGNRLIKGNLWVDQKNGYRSRRAPLQDTDGQHLAAISRARYRSLPKMDTDRDMPRCKIPMGTIESTISTSTKPPCHQV